MRKLTTAVLAFCFSASVLVAQAKLSKGNKDRPPTRTADTMTIWVKPSTDQVYLESVVEVRPEILSGPTLVYPDSLRQAGVQGRVIVQAVIDTMGRAEPRSVKIIESPHAGFDESARQYALGAIFRPARVHGHGVRVLVNIPIDFSIHPTR